MTYILKFLQWLKNRLFEKPTQKATIERTPCSVKIEPLTVGKKFKLQKPVNKRHKRSIFARDLRTLKTLY